MHLFIGDEVAAVNEKDGRKQARNLRRRAKPPAQSSDHPEELDEAQRAGVDDDPEGEEFSSVDLQVGHEVEDEGEARYLYHDDGDVGDGVGDAECGGAVEAEAFVAHQDWPAHERGGGFRQGLEKEVEDGEEEDAWAKEDGHAGLWEVVEKAAADEGLDDG